MYNVQCIFFELESFDEFGFIFVKVQGSCGKK